MTTRNLARTVIEGGRTGHYKAEVHKRIRQERAKNRACLHALALDPDSLDDSSAPVRKPVSPEFDDKLHPIYQFLDTCVGRSWDTARSELFKRFDTRTTPGRHVLFDHLLAGVCQDPHAAPDAPHRRWKSYFVDAAGILRKVKRTRYRSSEQLNLGPIAAWLKGRKVGRAGASFFWFLPTSKSRITTVVEYGVFVYAFADENGEAIRDPPLFARAHESMRHRGLFLKGPARLRRADHLPFRQAQRLNTREEAFLRSLKPAELAKVLEVAPVNV